VQPIATREGFRGRYLRVEIETWPSGDWEVLRHPGACAVVAVTPDDEVVLVRQFRPAIRRSILEVPAGLLDVEGEAPVDCAIRELMEETGHTASDVRSLGSFLTSPGMTDERFHLFGASAVRHNGREPEEGIEIVSMPFEEALRQARSGALEDSKSALAIVLAEAIRAGTLR
jgi:ADP-ribose pyrophosphatase